MNIRNKIVRRQGIYIILGLFLFIFQTASVRASDLAITKLDIAAMSGDRLQIQLEMNGAAVEPKVFHTDNPARIALDFSGVKNALAKKMIPINRGAVSTIYVAEAADRVRVVVNLLESTPFETKVLGNKVLLTLSRANSMAPTKIKPISERPGAPVAVKSANSVARALIPEQTISGFDFKRGDRGEGRILVYLANPDTIVNSRQVGGKVVINLLNTRLPGNLAKRLDVSEFATPIRFIDTTSSNHETTMTVTTLNDLYDYSLFQSEGLLTIEFRPLSIAEKEALDSTRVKYKGDRLSLNFQDIEIRNVIAILAEFTGQNVVAGDDVNGKITLKLDDVPWDEALDFIMMTKGLEKFESGTVTLIAPVGKIKVYKEQQQATAAVIDQLDPLVTEYIKINYAKANDYRNLLNGLDTGASSSCGPSTSTTSTTISSPGISPVTIDKTSPSTQGGYQTSQNQGAEISGSNGNNDKFGLLTSRGSAVVDARTNTLIVRETTKRLEEIKKLIRKLDVPVRQVMIEARVVIASTNFTKNLGVKFGLAGKNEKFGTSSGAVGSVNPRGGTVGSINGTGIVNDALIDLGAAAIAGTPPGALGMTLARGADYVLNLELQALQAEGKAEILSNPRVMTMEHCAAIMTQGVQIPVTTPGAVGVPATTTYVPAVLELNVTPQITPSGSVIMNLLVKKDSQNASSNPVSGNPGIDTRQVKTSALVEDGETVVLGGVYENTDTTGKNKIPFFADLPGIGFLFTNSSIIRNNSELLIFVTPKIITDNAASN